MRERLSDFATPLQRSPMSATSPLGAISAEVTALEDYAAVRYTNIAFLMFMVFDHVITFDTEVSRIWTLKWRLPKVLFLINRYVQPSLFRQIRRCSSDPLQSS
ncbi:hypothetical protein B0H12DRAFT_432233 [Mycena haematopus]|nr:hypothetical protein B0H12DRAFT_432233 [Mycena haematopus]